MENQEEILTLLVRRGGQWGTKIVNKNFVNKLAFPIDPEILQSGFGLNCLQKNSRRLELSISKNTPHRRWRQGPGSVDQTFPPVLPFLVPEVLEFVAFRDSGKFVQQFSWDFPGVFLGSPRADPANSHSLLEFSDVYFR